MRSLSAKTATTAALCVLWAATIALNWPGHLSTDSVIELLEGRTGQYESWHPAVTSWLLGIADSILRGPGLFIVFNVTLFYGSLLLLVRLRQKTNWFALPLILLFAATPQFLLYPGIVWKDVLFAAASIAGFCCLAFAAARWQRQWQHLAATTLAILFFTLAALTRQNGLVIALTGVATYLAIAHKNSAHPRTAFAQTFVFLIALTAAIAICMTALAARGDHGKGRADEIKMLQLYDFAATTARDPSLKLADLHQSDPTFEHLIRTEGARLFTPERVDSLQRFTDLEQARDAAPAPLMMRQWLHLIAHHPLLYLRTRAEIFRWVFLTPEIDRCVPFLVGVSGPQPVLDKLNMPSRYDSRDEQLENYANPLVHTPIFSHATFAILAALLFVLLLRRRAPADIAIVFLLAGSGAFALTFFALSLACDYRYLYLLDMAAMVAAIHTALGSPARS